MFRLVRQEIAKIRSGLNNLDGVLKVTGPEVYKTSFGQWLFHRGNWRETKRINEENNRRFLYWQQGIRRATWVRKLIGHGGSGILLWCSLWYRSVGLCLLAILWYCLMLIGLSRVMCSHPEPEFLRCGRPIQQENVRAVFRWSGFVIGAIAGFILGSGVGIAAGPLGAIAGTLPGTIIGGLIGGLGGECAGHKLEERH